ncbi:MAG TPA: hypothetical protein DEH22_07045 [Chloroflexi bacterium]|nr:hypothetical protein [Chloroflexota bacterium]
MRKFSLWTSILILVLILCLGALTGCEASPATLQAEVALPSDTPAVIPPSETPIPATATFTPEPPTATPTASATETPSPSPTQTATATEVPVMASLYAYTICRFGPSTAFEAHTYFQEDGSAIVRGRLDDDSWYLIELPESGETCWIFNEVIDLVAPDLALMPVLTPPPLPTPAPLPTKTEEELALGPKYYLLIPDNGGPFACGDGLVYFYSNQKSKDVEEDIKAALNALFSVRSKYVGNYYNPVYQSSLRAKTVTVENGNATVWLAGNFVKPKSKCEADRIHVQVWETVSQFPEVRNRPIIWVNNVLLGDLLEAIQE